MIHHQTGIRSAPRQRRFGPGLVDDETVFVILRKQAADVADVVRKAGDQDMEVVLRRKMRMEITSREDRLSG